MKKLNILSLVVVAVVFFMSFTNDEGTPNTFKIIQSDTKFSDDFCETAIDAGNWCGFRYKNKRNIIQFDTGLKVEFFSMDEIGETNSNCILTDYRDFSNDVWRFTPEGKIVHLISKVTKK